MPGGALRLRRLRRGPPRAGLGGRGRAQAPGLRRRPRRPRDRGAAPAGRRPRPAVRGDPRRLEGLRQARGADQPAAQGRHAAGRRGDVLHLPRRAGQRRGRLEAGVRPARHLQGPARRATPTRSCCRSTSSSRDEFSADAETRTVPVSEIPEGWMGLDVGPETVRLFGAAARRRGHGVLERPDGRVRDGAVRGGHHGRRRGRRGLAAPSASSAAATPPRRSAPRASTRSASATSPPGAARRWSSSRATSCPVSPSSEDDDDGPQAADRGQLEDEPQPPRGHRGDPEARLRAARQVLRPRRRGGAPAVHRPAQRADPRRRRLDADHLRRPGPLARRTPGRSPATSRARCWRSSAARWVVRRALRAAHDPRRGRRAGQPQGPRGAAARPDPDPLPGGGRGGPRRRRPRAALHRVSSTGRSTASSADQVATDRRSPTSRSGRSAPARPPASRTPRRCAHALRERLARERTASRSPTRCGSSTAGR